MDLKYNATVELSPDDVKKIIEEAVASQVRGFAIKRVDFQVEKQLQGYGMGEHYTAVFTGVKVAMAPKILGD